MASDGASALGAARALARRLLPLEARVAIRRAPAALIHALGPEPPRASDRTPFAHVQCRRSTPLRRPGSPYGEAMQLGKERNVALVAARVDGAVVAPGAEFSWHRYVGPPLRGRGFAMGPEIRAGKLQEGIGGGACQVANLVYWLALHAGMEIAERHRHDLDLFPDHERTAPFGCGASVFFPTRDLRFRNPLASSLLLSIRIEGGAVHGEARLDADPGARWEVVERAARFFREGQDVLRENRLWRVRTGADGSRSEELVAENRAIVLYPVPGLSSP